MMRLLCVLALCFSTSGACRLTQWMEWSPCTGPCEASRSVRSRNVVFIEPDPVTGLVEDSQCPHVFEVKLCKRPECDLYPEVPTEHTDDRCYVSNWDDWGECVGDCAKALQVRNRHVLYPSVPNDEGVIKSPCPHMYEIKRCELIECTATTETTTTTTKAATTTVEVVPESTTTVEDVVDELVQQISDEQPVATEEAPESNNIRRRPALPAVLTPEALQIQLPPVLQHAPVQPAQAPVQIRPTVPFPFQQQQQPGFAGMYPQQGFPGYPQQQPWQVQQAQQAAYAQQFANNMHAQAAAALQANQRPVFPGNQQPDFVIPDEYLPYVTDRYSGQVHPQLVANFMNAQSTWSDAEVAKFRELQHAKRIAMGVERPTAGVSTDPGQQLSAFLGNLLQNNGATVNRISEPSGNQFVDPESGVVIEDAQFLDPITGRVLDDELKLQITESAAEVTPWDPYEEDKDTVTVNPYEDFDREQAAKVAAEDAPESPNNDEMQISDAGSSQPSTIFIDPLEKKPMVQLGSSKPLESPDAPLDTSTPPALHEVARPTYHQLVQSHSFARPLPSPVSPQAHFFQPSSLHALAQQRVEQQQFIPQPQTAISFDQQISSGLSPVAEQMSVFGHQPLPNSGPPAQTVDHQAILSHEQLLARQQVLAAQVQTQLLERQTLPESEEVSVESQPSYAISENNFGVGGVEEVVLENSPAQEVAPVSEIDDLVEVKSGVSVEEPQRSTGRRSIEDSRLPVAGVSPARDPRPVKRRPLMHKAGLSDMQIQEIFDKIDTQVALATGELTAEEISCKVGDWGLWSPCRGSCEASWRIRHRPVLQPLLLQHGYVSKACPSLYEVKLCTFPECEAGLRADPADPEDFTGYDIFDRKYLPTVQPTSAVPFESLVRDSLRQASHGRDSDIRRRQPQPHPTVNDALVASRSAHRGPGMIFVDPEDHKEIMSENHRQWKPESRVDPVMKILGRKSDLRNIAPAAELTTDRQMDLADTPRQNFTNYVSLVQQYRSWLRGEGPKPVIPKPKDTYQEIEQPLAPINKQKGCRPPMQVVESCTDGQPPQIVSRWYRPEQIDMPFKFKEDCEMLCFTEADKLAFAANRERPRE